MSDFNHLHPFRMECIFRYIKDVEFCEGLEEILPGEFSCCRYLESITLPDSVKSIGEKAFLLCGELLKVNFGIGLESIETDCFLGCSKLEAVDIRFSNVEVIDASAFNACIRLNKVELSSCLEVIGLHAFHGCKSLECIDIPSSVKKLGIGAFSKCFGLKQVNLNEGLTTIEAKAFKGCEKLRSVSIPSTVVMIGEHAFYDCSGLETVGIQCQSEEFEQVELIKGITNIMKGTFEKCQRLKSISIPPNVTEIGERAFYDCSILEDLELYEGLEKIEKEAFKWCGMLKIITIPPSVTVIGEHAFACCKRLREVELFPGTKKIENGAFMGCHGLSIISCPSFVPGEDHVSRLPDGLETIGKDAFKSCALITIVIPATVKVIKEHAFDGCNRLRCATLNDGLVEIEDGAFDNCACLTSIDIPSTVRVIRKNAFSRQSLQEIQFGTQMETFVDMISIGEWWQNVGDYLPHILLTYTFLVQSNIISRLHCLKATKWQESIYLMFRDVPKSELDMDLYHQTIEEKLHDFEIEKNWMENAATELDLYQRRHWKTSCDNMIIANVMSFLLPSGQSLSLFRNYAKKSSKKSSKKRKRSHTVVVVDLH